MYSVAANGRLVVWSCDTALDELEVAPYKIQSVDSYNEETSKERAKQGTEYM